MHPLSQKFFPLQSETRRNRIHFAFIRLAQECGELATPLVTVEPVGSPPPPLYSACMYISCYLSDNKPVLSYLLLRLLPQWLYPLYCTLYCCTLTTHTYTSAAIGANHSLSSALVSDISFCNLQCTFHWLQLSQHFLLAILQCSETTLTGESWFHIRPPGD